MRYLQKLFRVHVEAERRLKCVTSVKKFSSKASPQHYYTCRTPKVQNITPFHLGDGGKEHPELGKCPDDLVYHTRKQVTLKY